MPTSLQRTTSPDKALVAIIKKPSVAEPNKTIQSSRRTPKKGFLDSFKSFLRSCGSKVKISTRLEVLLKRINWHVQFPHLPV